MTGYSLTLSGIALEALGSGALYWPEQKLLCVSDLHFGKSERIARLGGANLPPYDTRDTLARLEKDLLRTRARTVVCLGDSFDDSSAARGISEAEFTWITRLQAGRRWVWIEGNHDPGPLAIGGTHLSELSLPPILFRHIAKSSAQGEISGHYHPKAQVKTKAGTISRPCFLVDARRIILPAYGSYTGGLRSSEQALADLMQPDALAILTGTTPQPIPMPGRRQAET